MEPLLSSILQILELHVAHTAQPIHKDTLAPSHAMTYTYKAPTYKFKYLLKPAGICTVDFPDFQPVARKQQPKAKVVAGKYISCNTFKGGPTTCSLFLFRVNRNVSEAIVKEHMNGKDLKYVSIKTMSKAEAVLNRL